MEYTRDDYRRVYGEPEEARGILLSVREYVLIAIAAVVLALLAGCDDGQAAEITHQMVLDARHQHEINEKIAAHHAAILTALHRGQQITLIVDSKPLASCRPIRRKP